uniref:Uncharacterized protein n=1 Tax=Tanacetum cinerariifolium TaxID=118510 RepID=A0A6L2LUJ9_TANCI|nr:hypothetical protein [Tanacetum cinerariifolium]
MVFHKMNTEEVSDRFVALYFVNGLEAYDGEINLGVEENMILNEYALKICLEHKVKRGNKIVKKEIIVALRGEIYIVKFIINLEEDDVEPGVIFGGSFLRMTKAITDIRKKVLDEIWKDKVELDGMIVKEEEEAIKKVGVTTLIAKFLILDIPIDRDASIVVGLGFLRMIGGIVNTLERLFLTFDGFCHQTIRTARSDIMRNVESDSNDEEEYEIKTNKFRAPIYGLKLTPYLNCNDPAERSLALQTVTNLFRKISVWNKAVSFLGLLPVPLKHVNWKPDYKGCYTKEEEATRQWCTEIRVTDPYGNIYIQGFTTKKTDRGNDAESGSSRSKCSRQIETIEKDVLNGMGCDGEIDDMLRIKLREAKSNEEIFTLVVWIRAFNIKEPIYAELCHEFYSTYEFNEEYWLSISREENLGLSRSHASTIKNPNLRVIHKMITYGLCQRTIGYNKIQKNDLCLLSMFEARHQNRYANVAWLITRDMKRKGVGTQRESQICCGQFITKIARKIRVLTDAVLKSLSTLIYCKYLDTTTLRELIDSKGRLIPEDPMGSMEIRQDAIERLEYRQSYHWDSSMDGLDAMLENGLWFIWNNLLILKKWHLYKNLLKEDAITNPGRSSYARVMIELRADVELKDYIVVAMPRIKGGYYTCASKKKTVKKPSQTSRGVSVGPKIGFKPQKEYRLDPKKHNASFSSNKKKGVEPTIEVSNSNPFDVLNTVDNDVEFGTNGRTTSLVNNEATSSRSSFMNIDNDGEFASNTPIGEKIDKIE